jgi:HPr kinase/phosphorylase
LTPEITPRKILEDENFHLDVTLVAGEGGLDNIILNHRIQKPGLALAGFFNQLQTNRVQVFGESEIEYLISHLEDNRKTSINQVFEMGLACFVVTKGLELPDLLLELANKHNIPLLLSPLRTSVFIERVERLLVNTLAPTTHVHGVLVDVLGVGIFLRGASGVGKSECALDLVMRGHRLVADDIVEIHKFPPFKLVGKGAGIIRYHMEIRGLGILNVQDLFGSMAVRTEKSIDLLVDLVPWKDGETYERLGLDEQYQQILEVDIQCITLPVAPGRNISSIVEVAARNYLLKLMGKNSAMDMQDALEKKLKE